MKKLFLSHEHRAAGEISSLAAELRVRGIVPWVDKDGGFHVADDSIQAAAKAIKEESLGFALYADERALASRFIRLFEVPPAIAAREGNPEYLMFAIPVRMSFAELRARSEDQFGQDLSRFHTVPVTGKSLRKYRTEHAAVAHEVLLRVAGGALCHSTDTVVVQFSTWEAVSHEADELLFIDGRAHFDRKGRKPALEQLLQGMRDVKAAIAKYSGRPRIRVEGSKHLSAAFAFGRVFQPFQFAIRQTPDSYWKTDALAETSLRFGERLTRGARSDILAIEISTGFKQLSNDVDAVLKAEEFSRLVLRPDEPIEVTNEICCGLAAQAYTAIERAVQEVRPNEIHLFAAAPQSLMMMLGRKFAGMPPTTAYDFIDGRYQTRWVIPGGVL